MAPLDLQLGGGELGAVAWDWVTFTQQTDTVFDFELFQRAHVYYGTESGALPAPAKIKEACCLMVPTIVLPQQIFGYASGSMAAEQGLALGLGNVAAERIYVDLSGGFPKTIQSARFDSGYAVITESGLESLFVDGELASLVFHLDRPSKVLKPIREQHECYWCGQIQRSCRCTLDPTTSATAELQNLWKMSSGVVGTDPSGFDSWHRYIDFLQKLICNFCNFCAMFRWSVSTTSDAEELGLVDPLREEIDLRFGDIGSGTILESMKQMFMERLMSQWCPSRRLVDVEARSHSVSLPRTRSGESTTTMTTKAARTIAGDRATCKICGLQFGRAAAERRHFRTVHQEVREFECEHCGRTFSLRHHLLSHVAAVHEGRRDYPCNICGKAFSTEAKVNRHRRSVHEKERRLKCPSCDQTFFQGSDLERHRKRVHPALPSSTGMQEGILAPFGSDLSEATVDTEIGATGGGAVACASGRSRGRQGCA